jgi:MoxR-like ATPase
MELSREEVQRRLAEVGYVANQRLAMAITLMRTLERPLLLEGEAGVDKTEVTRVALTPKVGVGLSLLRSPPWHNASG